MLFLFYLNKCLFFNNIVTRGDMMVEKNKEYELDIIGQGYEGEGIAKVDGYPIFIKGALSGERIKVKIVKVNKNFAYGRIEEILEASLDRVEPKCANYNRCGGCSIQHMSYNKQLDFKVERVRDCMTRIGGIDGDLVKYPIGMEVPYRYRNKVQLPIGSVNGKIAIGFYAPRSHDIVDIRECLIQDEVADSISEITRKWISKNSIAPVMVDGKFNPDGLVRHIMIRRGFKTREVMVVLVVTKFDIPKIDEFKENILKEVKDIKSIVLNINSKNTNVILSDECKTIYGSDTISDYIANLKFNISPLSFFQVNPIQTEVLYDTVFEYANLTGNETVIDAYCGTGTITLFLAKKAKKVYGVEVVLSAIENAVENAKVNCIDNVEFIVGKAEEEIGNLIENGVKADVIVVDPPRKGCDLSLLKAISESDISRIVYVSCDPSTLGRDIKILDTYGYKVKKIQPVDMFSQTSHVETVVLLSKGEIDSKKVRVEFSMEDMDMSGFQKSATYEEIKAYVKEQTGLKVSSLYISQVKRKCGIEVGQNYNVSKNEDTKQPQCPIEKEEAIKNALEHFKMI